MRAGILESGDKMYVVQTLHYVKLGDYATALADYFYNNNEDFDIKLTKQGAEKILKRSLFFYGLDGQYEPGYFEASYELGELYNKAYSDAKNWLIKKYKHFKP